MGEIMAKTATIVVDERGRAALSKVAAPGTYIATCNPDGTVLLAPARTLTEAEIALLGNPQAAAALDAAKAGTAKTVAWDPFAEGGTGAPAR
jgi:hypothetical protein